MSPRRIALLVLLLTVMLTGLPALDVEEGKLKLVLHEGIGRFSLFYDSVSLFVDQDPRTSGLALVINNKVFKLGEGGEFQESAERTAGGARFFWRSKRLTVSESFSFGIPSGISAQKGLVIDVTLTNTSDSDLSVGFRFILDTYLGEESYPHFQTEKKRDINNELTYGRENMPTSWLSAANRPEGAIGLQGYLQGGALTVPERVVFANWKRLSEASWSYDTSPARSFSDLPYSINDSALCHYYDPIPIAGNASRSIRLFLAPYVGLSSSAPAAEAAPIQELRGQGEAGGSVADSLSIEGDIMVLNRLLQQLDLRLGSGAVFTEEELRLMSEILSDIKKRLERYSE